MTHRILFSGGKDSLLTLHRVNALLKPGDKKLLHYFDVGHLAAKPEKRAVLYYADQYTWRPVIDSVPTVRIPSGMRYPDGRDNHMVFRNMLLLSLAINLYYDEEPTTWYLGFPNYPDAPFHDGNPAYLKRMKNVVTPLYPHVDVKTVIGRVYPENILDILVKEDADVSHLWFCDNDGLNTQGLMCGQCIKCVKTLEFLAPKPYFHLFKDRYAKLP